MTESPTIPESQEPKTKDRYISRLIMICSAIIVGGGLFFAAGVTLFTWATEIRWEEFEKQALEPMEGELVVIEELETFFIYKEGLYLPASKITLDDNSKSAKLRFIFRSNTDTIIGFPVTVDVNNGQFESGKVHQIKATTGLKGEGTLHAYLDGDIKDWIMIVYEAPISASSPSDYSEIARIPISRNLTL